MSAYKMLVNPLRLVVGPTLHGKEENIKQEVLNIIFDLVLKISLFLCEASGIVVHGRPYCAYKE